MITADDKLACVRRELRMREKVYPRWVTEGRMTDGHAMAQIEIMRAIVADYEHAAAQERLL